MEVSVACFENCFGVGKMQQKPTSSILKTIALGGVIGFLHSFFFSSESINTQISCYLLNKKIPLKHYKSG